MRPVNSQQEVAIARSHVQEMRERSQLVADRANKAAETLKTIFKGFNGPELDEALKRVANILSSEMRL